MDDAAAAAADDDDDDDAAAAMLPAARGFAPAWPLRVRCGPPPVPPVPPLNPAEAAASSSSGPLEGSWRQTKARASRRGQALLSICAAARRHTSATQAATRALSASSPGPAAV